MNTSHFLSRLTLLCVSITGTALADHDDNVRPDSHAPIGVMGDHLHKKGEWMFSYRYMQMSMDDLSDDGDSLSPEEIATTAVNPFFGAPGQPPTLRVVPTEMTMDMHMVGFMYAPTDRVTLMVMGQYIEKDMQHITFRGPRGTDRLGNFTTRSSGLGDTRVSALIGLRQTESSTTHATVGLSLPTGSTEEQDDVLAPTGMRPTLRLPYPMQLGSGSYDPILGMTHVEFRDRYSFGGQWTSVLRIEDNDDSYRFGDEHTATGWLAWQANRQLSLSSRLSWRMQGDVDDRDQRIIAPVQTADPDRQAGRRIDLGLGLNWAGQGDWRGHRLSLEWLVPLDQDLDGPQLETEWTATLGYQYAF
ncbi:MAG: transporter [Pseudomonadota bacterium]